MFSVEPSVVGLAEHCSAAVARQGVVTAMPVTRDAEQAFVAYDAALEGTFPLAD